MGDPLGHNYELLEPIGYGAFGRVWRAKTRNGEIVAAKLLRPEYATDDSVRARFLREHVVLKRVRHPHIVGVRDLVIEGDVLALVLEYVDGPSLRRLLAKQGPLAPAEAARLVAEVCDGLAALHAAGILHRDVKPDNVLLQRGDDGRWHAKLGDFGLARLLGSTLTRTGAFTGTFDYAAPELAGGEPVTAAADLYATGIVLYELLCGVTPFHAEHPVTVVQRHQSLPPPRPDGVPEQLWELISWLLAKQATQRPPDAGVVRDALIALAPSLAGLPAAPAFAEPPPPKVATAVTAAPHEPPWLTEPPTVIGLIESDRLAARRSTRVTGRIRVVPLAIPGDQREALRRSILVVIILIVGVIGSAWVRGHYAVGVKDRKVVVFQGISARPLGVDLQSVSATDVSIELLPVAEQGRILQRMPFRDRRSANLFVDALRQEAKQCASSLQPPCPPRTPVIPEVTAEVSTYPRGNVVTITWGQPDQRAGATTSLKVNSDAPSTGCPAIIKTAGHCSFGGSWARPYIVGAVVDTPGKTPARGAQTTVVTYPRPSLSVTPGPKFVVDGARYCTVLVSATGLAPNTTYKVRYDTDWHHTLGKSPYSLALSAATDARGNVRNADIGGYGYQDPAAIGWVQISLDKLTARRSPWACS